MANKRRTYRLAEQIREMIAWQLQRAADPRFNMVTITSVVVSPDMKNAKAYWVVSGSKDNIPEVTDAFESAAGLFKRSLAKELKLRFIPSIKFFYDDTFDVSDSVNKLFEKIRTEPSSNSSSSESRNENLAMKTTSLDNND